MNSKFEDLLGGMKVEEFLGNYWQKKPLVIKNALSNLDDLATKENMLEMGEDENFFTRMIINNEEDPKWDLKTGPFSRDDLMNIENRSTLIVHNLDLYFREFKEIKDKLDFAPNWQFDDIMACYSKKGSSTGAHIDNYNVFILQGTGSRNWELNENPSEEYIENLEIKILKEFEKEYEVTLNSGDILYIPAGVAHRGTSVDENISYSLGLRAFDNEDVIGSFFSEFMSNYFSTKSIKFNNYNTKNKNEFTDKDIVDLQKFFEKEILNKNKIRDWFGRYITRIQNDEFTFEPMSMNEFQDMLILGSELFKDPHLRFSYCEFESKIKFFVNGLEYIIERHEYKELEDLLNTPSYEALQIGESISKRTTEILLELRNSGALVFD